MVEEVVPGPAGLLLIGIYPWFQSAQLRDAIDMLRRVGDGSPVGAYLHADNGALARLTARLGVAGIVMPDAGVEIAIASVRVMVAGGNFLPPEAAEAAPDEPLGQAPTQGSRAAESLTSREFEVLQLLGVGRTNKGIAADLSISQSTVKVHLRRMMKKLGTTIRTEAALQLTRRAQPQVGADETGARRPCTNAWGKGEKWRRPANASAPRTLMTFPAIRVDKTEAGQNARFVEMDDAELMDGDVTIRVTHSTVNYKDGLALSGKSQSSVVSDGPRHRPGGDRRSVGHPAFAPAMRFWSMATASARPILAATPKGAGQGRLARQTAGRPDAAQAMAIGTAGFTAMLCVLGAGASGRHAAAWAGGGDGRGGRRRFDGDCLLAGGGWTVSPRPGALRRRTISGDWAPPKLRSRNAFGARKPLGKERWAAGVDSVGSHTLVNVLAQTRYGGAVAACGLGGRHGPARHGGAVHPSGRAALGVDSVNARWRAGSRPGAGSPGTSIGKSWRRSRTIPLAGVFEVGAKSCAGEVRGRIVVDLG